MLIRLRLDVTGGRGLCLGHCLPMPSSALRPCSPPPGTLPLAPGWTGAPHSTASNSWPLWALCQAEWGRWLPASFLGPASGAHRPPCSPPPELWASELPRLSSLPRAHQPRCSIGQGWAYRAWRQVVSVEGPGGQLGLTSPRLRPWAGVCQVLYPAPHHQARPLPRHPGWVAWGSTEPWPLVSQNPTRDISRLGASRRWAGILTSAKSTALEPPVCH